MHSKFLFLFFVFGLIASVFSYKDGAPLSACDHLTPDHGADPDTRPPPYNFLLEKKLIQSGETVEMTIWGKTATDRIKGFLVQARSDGKRIGHFDIDPNDTLVQPLNCGNVTASSATHRENSGVPSVTLKWVSPTDFKGQISFVTTIVLNKGTFWVGVASDKVDVK